MEAKKSGGILPGFGRNVVSTVKYNGGIIIGLLIICLDVYKRQQYWYPLSGQ